MLAKTSKNLKDIKILIGVSDSISPDNLLINIIDNMKSSLSSIDPNSRLHPYFVLFTVGDRSKNDNNLASNDVTVLEALKPLLVQLRESVPDVFYLDKRKLIKRNNDK